MRHKNKLFSEVMVLTVAVGLFLTGCSKGKVEEAVYKVSENIEKRDDVLFRFVDAYGNGYEMWIDQGAKKQSYKKECFTMNENGWKVDYTGDSRYEVSNGVDVSYHQGDIDWDKVKEAGVEFAFIRIGYRGYGKEGTLHIDTKYYDNIEGAKKAGLKVGVYFFSQAVNIEEAKEEADFVLDTLAGEKLDLPVVFDPELINDSEARTDNVSGSQFTQNTIAFCNEIKAAGYKTMVYSNMYWEAKIFDVSEIQDFGIWYADYERRPQTPYAFEIWQYTEKAQVNGIKGGVDADLMFIPK